VFEDITKDFLNANKIKKNVEDLKKVLESPMNEEKHNKSEARVTKREDALSYEATIEDLRNQIAEMKSRIQTLETKNKKTSACSLF